MITYTFDLDITPGGVPLSVHTSQYDDNSRTYKFRLFSSAGALKLPAGVTAAIRGTKPDGNVFSYDAEIMGTEVSVVITKQMTAVAGKCRCEIVLYLGNTELGTANFLLVVEKTAMDKDSIRSDSEVRELVEIMDNSAEIIAAANQAKIAGETAKAYAQSAVGSANKARESAESAANTMQTVDQKVSEIAQIKTEADTIAAQALEKASNAENEVADNQNTLDNLKASDAAMQLVIEGKVDGAYVENGYLYLTSNDAVVAGPLGPFSGTGGSGGSGGNNAELSVVNATGWLSKTLAYGDDCSVVINWSSTEDDMPTGNGALKITVNGIVRAILDVPQGEVTADISRYLSVGSNVVKINVSDVYGNNRTINFSVTTIALSITSSFDASMPYTGPILFPYVPVGNVQKTVHFILDGKEIGSAVTSVSGRQQSFTIPQQTHGSHSFRVFFETEINGQSVRSNELYFEIICLELLNNTPVIISDFHETEVAQYTSVHIGYTVYDPASLTAKAAISVNGIKMSEQTVDRTQQVFTYRADEVGLLTILIKTGNISKKIEIDVKESQIRIDAETETLALHLTSYGRSNNEETKAAWEYKDIKASLTGFNYASDGWKTDDDGTTVLRVSGDARVTIPYKVFAADFRAGGKTIELEFATKDVMNYEAVILSCMSGGRGISLTPQKVTFKSEQAEIFTQYKENEHVRISFVIEKRSENRLIYCYINGIMSGVVQYPADDDFAQTEPVDISIGSNECTIDLYCIRVYDNDLTRHQILNNWIADTQVVDVMLERYKRNSIYDDYGNVVITQLPTDLPYLVLEAEELPQYKGDKKTVTGSFVDPITSANSFTFEGASANVQGTSSQYYARKNYKITFKKGFVMNNGRQADVYPLRYGAIGTDTFTFKADVASSEGANNVELARLYNDACPYKTPAQEKESAVRQGIDGFPIVIFWNDGKDTVFLGKYNFNNDKGTPEAFGFEEGDDSWEVLNNTSDRVLWKNADYSGDAWQNDFESRFPEDNLDSTQLAEFAAWIASTDTTMATGKALEKETAFDGTSYTHDTAEYRLAKFKSELGNYVEKDSALFYYLFTELFLMVDSRAKNMFPSFIGGTE